MLNYSLESTDYETSFRIYGHNRFFSSTHFAEMGALGGLWYSINIAILRSPMEVMDTVLVATICMSALEGA